MNRQDYAAHLYQLKYCELGKGFPLQSLPPDLRAKQVLIRRKNRKKARGTGELIRRAVRERDWLAALDSLASVVAFGDQRFLFLERAFPAMADDEVRADCLRYAWQRTKGARFRSRALRLFKVAAPGFTDLLSTWPDRITVYRGACTWSWPRARRRVRQGFSWTTDRSIAHDFASRLFGVPWEVDEIPVGCIGSARVSRRDVIAHFEDAPPGYEDYSERECIIDPALVTSITYERIHEGPRSGQCKE